METIEKNIINDYFLLLEKLSSAGKLELIERLVKSIKREKSSEGPTEKFLKTNRKIWRRKNEKNFLKQHVDLGSPRKSSDEIIKEIRDSHRFRDKKISL